MSFFMRSTVFVSADVAASRVRVRAGGLTHDRHRLRSGRATSLCL